MNRILRNPLAVDTETTGLHPYQGDKVIMASFADDTGAWAARPDEAEATLRQAIDAGRTIIMHNGIFDRSVFRAAWGLEVPDGAYWDTMAVDWLLDENADHRLKEGIGARLFGIKAAEEKRELQALMRGRTQADVYKELRAELPPRGEPGYESAAETRKRAKAIAEATTKTWAELTYDDLHAYAVQDAALTWRIFHWQTNALESDTYVHPYLNRVHDIMSLSYRINAAGIRVSEEWILAGRRDAEARVAAITAELGLEDVNLKSPNQVAELLYDTWGLPCSSTTDSGARSTDKFALNDLAYDPRVEQLLEYRALVKQVDAYYNPLLGSIGDDGRIHPTLHPCRTVTGRWSCSDPNLQTIPRESTAAEIRRVFRPAPGYALTEFDLSQIEVRIAAAMSREPALLRVYDEGGDVYQALADDLHVDRSTAKRVILSAQYGIGPKKLSIDLAQGTGEPPNYKRAKGVLDSYWRTYPYLDKLMRGLEERAIRRGYIPLWKPGRRRVFRSPHNPYPRWYTALNAAIQGGAAELMKDVLWELVPHVEEYWGIGRVVLTVHDSVIVEHEPGAEGMILDALETITKDVSPYAIATPWEMKGWDE